MSFSEGMVGSGGEPVANLFAMYPQSLLRASAAKCFAMKSLGKRVREFRLAPERKWSTARMAKEVGTSRQNIENLEAKGFGQPRYIAALARVMRTTVGELLGTDEPAVSSGADAVDEELSPSEWGHLQAYRDMAADDRRAIDAETEARAEKMRALRREVMEGLGLPPDAKAGAGDALPPAPRHRTAKAAPKAPEPIVVKRKVR